MPGYISDQTTVLSNLSLTGSFVISSISASNVSSSRISSNVSIIANEVWASGISTSRLTVQGGALFSGVTADFRTNLVVISVATLTTGSTLTTGQLGVLFQLSGMSLVFSSGKTLYTIGASAVSAVHP